MKAHLRDQKIAAAKARDAAFVDSLPANYRPKQPIESTTAAVRFAQSVGHRLQYEMEKQEKLLREKERLERLQKENPKVVLTIGGERITEIHDIKYEDKLILRPSDLIEQTNKEK